MHKLPISAQIQWYSVTDSKNHFTAFHFLQVAIQWPGLPAGVKFDPSDLELLEHLEQKIGMGGLKPHMFIDEFIPTVENDEGICYSHPENLPGMEFFFSWVGIGVL